MEKCPRCRAEKHRYTFRTRARRFIAVECEHCGYTGREIPMKHDRDTSAAFAAAEAWNASAAQLEAERLKPTVH